MTPDERNLLRAVKDAYVRRCRRKASDVGDTWTEWAGRVDAMTDEEFSYEMLAANALRCMRDGEHEAIDSLFRVLNAV